VDTGLWLGRPKWQNAKIAKMRRGHNQKQKQRQSQSERTSSSPPPLPPSWPLLIIVHLAVTEKGREIRKEEREASE